MKAILPVAATTCTPALASSHKRRPHESGRAQERVPGCCHALMLPGRKSGDMVTRRLTRGRLGDSTGSAVDLTGACRCLLIGRASSASAWPIRLTPIKDRIASLRLPNIPKATGLTWRYGQRAVQHRQGMFSNNHDSHVPRNPAPGRHSARPRIAVGRGELRQQGTTSIFRRSGDVLGRYFLGDSPPSPYRRLEVDIRCGCGY